MRRLVCQGLGERRGGWIAQGSQEAIVEGVRKQHLVEAHMAGPWCLIRWPACRRVDVALKDIDVVIARSATFRIRAKAAEDYIFTIHAITPADGVGHEPAELVSTQTLLARAALAALAGNGVVYRCLGKCHTPPRADLLQPTSLGVAAFQPRRRI